MSLLPVAIAVDPVTFHFTAAGDYGPITTGSRGKAVAEGIQARNPNFHIALGDFGYSQSPSDWCSTTSGLRKYYTGSLVLVTGNHDTKSPPDTLTGEESDQYLDTSSGYVSQCGAPAGINWIGSGVSYGGATCSVSWTLVSPSCYAREYYFDYPTSNPIMRFILISAGIGGSWVSYNSGSTHYSWLQDKIDEAKNAGLWVAVALHKNCISDATDHPNCSSTFDPFKLALTKNVDIWLDGHSHTYQRTKQLSSPASDPCIGSGTTFTYCHIANSGDGQSTPYVRGAGTVINVIGTGGVGNSNICVPGTCSNQNYFVKLCGANGQLSNVPATANCKNDYGFSSFTVTTTGISAQWVPVTCNSAPCTFTDSYSITQNPEVTDFSVSSSLARVSQGTRGADGTYSSVGIVSVNSFNQFSGTVTLTLSSLSGGPTGTCPGSSCPTVSLSSTSLSVPAGGTASATLTVDNTLNSPCSNPVNTPNVTRYTVTVTATSGSTSHHYVILVYIYGKGDIVKDGTVNILDIATVDLIYGSASGQSNFDPNMDLNNNGRIDIVDAATVAFYYGGTGC